MWLDVVPLQLVLVPLERVFLLKVSDDIGRRPANHQQFTSPPAKTADLPVPLLMQSDHFPEFPGGLVHTALLVQLGHHHQ